MNRCIGLTAAALLMVLAGGCAKDQPEPISQAARTPSPSPTPTSHQVKIVDGCAFDPWSNDVWPGDKVVFKNTLDCDVRIWTKDAKLFGKQVDETVPAGDSTDPYTVSRAAVHGSTHYVDSDNPRPGSDCCPTPTPVATGQPAQSDDDVHVLTRATFVIRDPRIAGDD